MSVSAADFDAAVIADAPVVYLKNSDAYGSAIAADASGNGHAGTPVGGVTFGQPGLIDDGSETSASFDGTTGRVSLGNPAALQITGNITLECLAMFTTATAGTIVAKGYDGTAQPYSLIVSGSVLTFQTFLSGHSPQNTYSVSVNISRFAANGGVHHIVATDDGANMTLYIDGIQVAQSAYGSGAGILSAGTGPVLIGALDNVGTPAQFFKGRIERVAIYNTCLSYTRIRVHARAAATRLCWDHVDRRRGCFIHFGLPTYANVDTGTGSESVNVFNPTSTAAQFDAKLDDALNYIVAAGFTYVVITSKHHDGFCNWPTSTTSHDIGHSSWYATNQYDYLGAFIAKAKARGLTVILYFSVYDKNWEAANPTHAGGDATYAAFAVSQIGELIALYDPAGIWTDGYGWHPGNSGMPYDDIAFSSIHGAITGDGRIHIENNHYFTPLGAPYGGPTAYVHDRVIAYSDIFEREMPGDVLNAADGSLPTETCRTTQADGTWHWHTGTNNLISAATLAAEIVAANSLRGTYLAGVPFDTSGGFTADEKTLLSGLGTQTYTRSATPAAVTPGSESGGISITFSAAASGVQAVTVTGDHAADVFTASDGTTGVGSIVLRPAYGATSITFTVNRATAGVSTLTFTNNFGGVDASSVALSFLTTLPLSGTLLDALYTTLSTSAGVLASFPGFTDSAGGSYYPVGVYRDLAPEGAPKPYVVSTVIATPSQQFYGGTRRSDISLQLAVYGIGHDATYGLLAPLFAVLDDVTLTLSTGTQFFVARENEPIPSWQEKDENGNDIWQWVVEYTFAVRS